MKPRIMYIEQGGGLAGAGRIGRVTFSKTGRTIYYAGRSFVALRGGGYKTSHLDEENRNEYWISSPRKDGQDTLYPGLVTIDEDAREVYWRDIRKQPENAHLATFRSLGRHAKKAKRANADPRGGVLTAGKEPQERQTPLETFDLEELRGIVKPRVRGVSVEDMQVAVHKAVAKRARKSRKV